MDSLDAIVDGIGTAVIEITLIELKGYLATLLDNRLGHTYVEDSVGCNGVDASEETAD